MVYCCKLKNPPALFAVKKVTDKEHKKLWVLHESGSCCCLPASLILLTFSFSIFYIDYFRLQRERDIQSKLEHENIVSYAGWKVTETEMLLFMEYFPLGSLRRCLDDLTLKEILMLSKQIASGLTYLHGNHIVHRDLKVRRARIRAPDFTFALSPRLG